MRIPTTATVVRHEPTADRPAHARGVLAGPVRQHPGPGEGTRGRIVTMVPLAGVAVLVMLGLAVDLVGQVQAEQSLRDIAGQCARHGATQVSLDGGADHAAGLAAAQACLSTWGVAGTVSSDHGGISVTAHTTYRTKLLTLIGITQLPAVGSASSLTWSDR